MDSTLVLVLFVLSICDELCCGVIFFVFIHEITDYYY